MSTWWRERQKKKEKKNNRKKQRTQVKTSSIPRKEEKRKEEKRREEKRRGKVGRTDEQWKETERGVGEKGRKGWVVCASRQKQGESLHHLVFYLTALLRRRLQLLSASGGARRSLPLPSLGIASSRSGVANPQRVARPRQPFSLESTNVDLV